MANSPDPSNSSPASEAPKRGLFSRKPKEAKAKKPSRLKQIGEVFQMTRRHDPMVPWLMLLAFLGGGRQLLTGDAYRSLAIWDLDAVSMVKRARRVAGREFTAEERSRFLEL